MTGNPIAELTAEEQKRLTELAKEDGDATVGSFAARVIRRALERDQAEERPADEEVAA